MPSLRITFAFDLVPDGTRQISADLAEVDGRIVFVTSDNTVIPTVAPVTQ